MKIILKLLTLPLLLPCLFLFAQVKTNFNNATIIGEQGQFAKQYKTQIDFEIPAKNIDTLLQIEKREMGKTDNEKPFRIAVPVPVNLDIGKLLQWNYTNDSAYGKFTIKINGALSSSINFDKFFLPNGTEMYIYNKNGNMITGPITENENNPNKVWGSWVYRGEILTIEIKTPISTLNQLLLHSDNVAYGYKEVYAKVAGFGTSGSCEINVLCPLGNGWEGERNSVALVLSDNGQDWCSGCIVMNTCSTNRPFFLTANHCLTGQDVSAWRFTFQAWSPTCTPSQNSDGVTYNGSTLRANYSNSDFCLVELNNIPPSNSGIDYAGWTRSATPAQNATGIHHPHGDVMKISRSDNAVTRTAYGGGVGNDHWMVNWSPQNNGAGQMVTAVTEPGSSGSPLFDQNHRIIGQLHGGPSACGGTQLWDFYGSFDVSWTGGGTDATRLSNWLDPSNSGAMTTNTTNISLLTSLNFSISGDNSFCTTSNDYTISNLPSDATVTWSSTPSGIVSINPSGNNATLTKITNGQITLTATIGNICGSSDIPIQKTVYVGTPTVDGVATNSYYVDDTFALVLYPDAYNLACTNYFVTTDMQITGATSTATWSKISSSGGTVIWTASNNNLHLNIKSTGGTALFQITANNTCGNTLQEYEWLASDCSGQYSLVYKVSPNPANNKVIITPANTVTADTTTITASRNLLALKTTAPATGVIIKQVKIFDVGGRLMKQMDYSTPQQHISIDVTALKPGIYFVSISDGKSMSYKKLLIQR